MPASFGYLYFIYVLPTRLIMVTLPTTGSGRIRLFMLFKHLTVYLTLCHHLKFILRAAHTAHVMFECFEILPFHLFAIFRPHQTS